MTDSLTDPIYKTDALIAEDIDAYLKVHEHKTMLRFITCGSVDDGKSTLIGRLLYDSKMIFEDQLEALTADSKKMGTQGQEIDFALLVDGLAAEREQGITIDVAYRFFATEKRKFIVADTPGHEQYTRNMVTGASTADLAVILIDARKGILTQTRRHSYLAHLIGIRNIVLAVNKMDLVGYDQSVFDTIVADYTEFAKSIGITAFTPMPISGFKGDNITVPSENTPWYTGPALIEHLETVEVNSATDAEKPFRMPVQWVNRPNLDFRGFSGLIATGTVKPGDAIRVLPSGKTSTISRIVTLDGDLDEAVAGQSVTLCFADEIDCSRGDVIALADNPPQAADQFEATIVWMADEEMLPGRSYWLKIGTQMVTATVQQPKYQVNDQLEFVQAFEIGHFRGIARFDQRFEPGLDQRGRAAAEDRLLAEQVGFAFFAEIGFDDAAATAADAAGVGQGDVMRVAGRILMDRDQAGDAAALHIFAADGVAGAFGCDHDHVHILARLDQAEMDVEAMGKGQRRARAQIGVDVVGINGGLMLVGGQDHEHVGPSGGFRVRHDLEARTLCLLGGGGAGAQRDRDFGDAAVTQILRMGMTLRTIAQDGDLLALDQADVRIVIVINLHDCLFPRTYLLAPPGRGYEILARRSRA